MLFNHLLDFEIDLQPDTDQIKLLTVQNHQLTELSEILKVIVCEVRKTLESDRVIIYRFLPDGDGVIAEESVSRAWKPILGQLIYDPCFKATWVERYRQGKVSVVEDVEAKTLDPCYKKLLKDLQIRANLVVPILVNYQESADISSSSPQLWGLLIANQCSSPRKWISLEIEYLQVIAAELGIILWQLQCHQYLKKLTVTSKLKLGSTKITLPHNHQESITTAMALSRHITVADLMAFERLQTPIWIYDIEKLQMWWANSSAVHIWNAQSRDELLSRNFSDVSESTRVRLQSYLHQFNQGKTIAENWTFYPEGKPVSVRCLCSGVEIKQGQMVMLVEGTAEVANQIDQETLRSIEALRHTTLMISLYTVVVTESVAENWQPPPNSDIYTAELLEQLPATTKLVVSILQGDRLWGQLVVDHCGTEREWQPWESELLQQLATQVAIAIQQSELYHQLQLANQQLENIAMIDQLTQIANRRKFDHKLDCVWQYFLREEGCVSLLLCDIDYFKRYNDTYGHAAGDDCLRLVAQTLQQTVKRSTDLVARYGGEEFVVILPNTNSEGAFQVAQEIHQAIQNLSIPHTASDVKPDVTMSIGIATVIPTQKMMPLHLIEAADQALYQAKAQGRNRSFVSTNSIPVQS